MALQSTDLLVVERGGVQYQLTVNALRQFIGTNYVVADIAARDALSASDGLSEGDRAFVVNASADATVNSGSAEYIYDGTSWIKVTEVESLDLTGATPTNLSYNSSTDTIVNDNGTNVTLPTVTGTNNGLATPAILNNSHSAASSGGSSSTNPVVVNGGTQVITFSIANLASA
jgi:hypothetical protein